MKQRRVAKTREADEHIEHTEADRRKIVHVKVGHLEVDGMKIDCMRVDDMEVEVDCTEAEHGCAEVEHSMVSTLLRRLFYDEIP